MYSLNICNITPKLGVIFRYVKVYLQIIYIYIYVCVCIYISVYDIFPCQSSQVYIQWLLIYCHQTETKKEVYAVTSLFYFLQKYYSIKVTYIVSICYHTSFPAPEMRDSSGMQHTHTNTRTQRHTNTHAQTHTQTRTHTHTHTHSQSPFSI